MGVSSAKSFSPEASKVLQRQVDISAGGAREIAHFAAGCFWSIEMAFQRVPGVIRTEVGYTQGMKQNPTYDEGNIVVHISTLSNLLTRPFQHPITHPLACMVLQPVCSGMTGHAEAVLVEFDTSAVTYDHLLTVFFDIHDPTTKNRQGGDVGTQYRSGLYYLNERQKESAISARDKINKSKKYENPVVTEIAPANQWYRAEEYHQRYLEKGGQCARKGSLDPIRCYG